MNDTKEHTRPFEFYQALPKVDLHRHLEGSLRFETVREVARAHSLDLPATGQLRGLVQIQRDEPLSFENFLSKFSTLRLLYRSPEIINRVTREAIADAAADNVRYLELRFTPVALSKSQGFSLAQVIDWVIEAARQGQAETGLTTCLIASINRHEGLDLAEQVCRCAVERKGEGIVGLDLAGHEPGFPAQPFAAIFHQAKNAGLRATIHAGEWDHGDNVAGAIKELDADRIGHGIRALESPLAVELALNGQTPFEVCMTSNYQSGVVADIRLHPITQMLARGLNVTINTDDPGISQIRLSDEYRLFCETLNFPLDTLRGRVLAAARAAFLSESERNRLVQSIDEEFQSHL